MTLYAAVPMSYFHECYLGRPSCPKCGELLMAPESSEYRTGHDIRHTWLCETCDWPFETLICLDATGLGAERVTHASAP